MDYLEEGRRLTTTDTSMAVSNAEWRRLVAGLVKEVERLQANDRRLSDMLPLFQEARDALPGIKMTTAQLRGIRLDLADRMDAVGVPELWKAMDAERQKEATR